MMTEDGTDSSHTEGSKWPPRGREEQVLLGTAKSGFQMGSQGPFTYYTIPKGSPKLFLCSSSSTIGRDTYYLKVKLLTNNSYYGVLLDYMARDVLKGKKIGLARSYLPLKCWGVLQVRKMHV